MKFYCLPFILFSSIIFAQKTINSVQNASRTIYDETSITFEPGSQIVSSNQSTYFAYIDNIYANDLNFEYDLSGNQIKRYLTLVISSGRPNSDNTTSYDIVEIVEELPESIETVFEVYPNPTPGPLNIKWNTQEEIKDIQLYDLTGKEIKNYQLNKLFNRIELNISNVPSGIYMLKFITEKGKIISKKIIKK